MDADLTATSADLTATSADLTATSAARPADLPLPLADVDQLVSMLAAAETVTDSIVGGDAIGVLAHSLQCADVLAAARPDDIELQVAGLVHDVGHLLVPGDADGHGRHGAQAVAGLLGRRVAGLVELHVPAKRYLVTTDPDYRASLSPGSIRTLELQGGLLDDEAVARFEAEPLAADALVLRRADEAAKIPGRPVPGLSVWKPVLDQIAALR
jgi:predicted HD phosphohydrolase